MATKFADLGKAASGKRKRLTTTNSSSSCRESHTRKNL